MHFAINYSPQAAHLVRSGAIEIDLFKCPDWPELIDEARAIRPVYVHFPISVGNQSLHEIDFAAVERWLTTTETAYVNAHLTATHKALGDDADRDTTLAALTQDVEQLTRRFGAERVIVENIPYRGPHHKYLPHTIDPQVITHVVDDTGCGLLLDLSHAVITCQYTGDVFEDYIAALPLHRLRELHITGIEIIDGQYVDHMPLYADDWARVTWAIERITAGDWPQPYVMAFEYGGITDKFDWRSQPDIIADQVPRLFDLARLTPSSA